MRTQDQIIETTCALLETQGYHATGLNQILKESGAPKGSLYYYFPDGKEGLTAEAITRTGQIVEARIRETLAARDDPAGAVRHFLTVLADRVEASGYQGGSPITTVALETATSSERLNRVCREVYGHWQAAFEDTLRAGGVPAARAASLATVVLATIEGAIVLCRTRRTTEPLRAAAEELARLIATEPGE